jgi:hypothetical protein
MSAKMNAMSTIDTLFITIGPGWLKGGLVSQDLDFQHHMSWTLLYSMVRGERWSLFF